jgi:hypothetical protein
VFKIVNIGFMTESTPDSQFNFDVLVQDFDGDASATQSLTINVTGDPATTTLAAPASNTLLFQETNSDWSASDMTMDLSRMAHIA